MRKDYTTEELLGFSKQPEDSCPHFNNIIFNIQKMINTNDNLVDEILKSFESGLSVIDKIKSWNSEWESKFSNIDKQSKENSFYITFAEDSILKISNFNFFEKKEEFEFLINNDFFNALKDRKLIDGEIGLNSEEIYDDKLYIQMKRNQVLDIVESFRDYASCKRAYTNYMKMAYVNHSVIHELNDIVRPYDIINDEMKKDGKTYNLGVIFGEPSFSKLIKDGILSDIDVILIKNSDNKNKKELLLKKINESGFDKVSFYESLDDFRNKKGYKSVSTLKPLSQKSNLKQF